VLTEELPIALAAGRDYHSAREAAVGVALHSIIHPNSRDWNPISFRGDGAVHDPLCVRDTRWAMGMSQ
jgi:hypothetical protein